MKANENSHLDIHSISEEIMNDLRSGFEEVVKSITIGNRMRLLYFKSLKKLNKIKYSVVVVYTENDNSVHRDTFDFELKSACMCFINSIISSPYIKCCKVVNKYE